MSAPLGLSATGLHFDESARQDPTAVGGVANDDDTDDNQRRSEGLQTSLSGRGLVPRPTPQQQQRTAVALPGFQYSSSTDDTPRNDDPRGPDGGDHPTAVARKGLENGFNEATSRPVQQQQQEEDDNDDDTAQPKQPRHRHHNGAVASSNGHDSYHHHNGINNTTTASALPPSLYTAPPRKRLGDVVLRLKNVSKTYRIAKSDESVHALDDISLCEGPAGSEYTADAGSYFPPIRRGEFVMIRGPSGGGKTTLLNIIGTIDHPTGGTVELLGRPINYGGDDDYLSELRLKYLGFVFQTFNLLATMSALENVELPMTLLGTLSADERRRRAKQLLALVGLRNRAGHLPSELSGGEQQRTTIARSLANNPAILLLDEPTGDLDTSTTIDVMDLLLRINNLAGTTCIMVTHNPDVECYADRILYVEDGRFVRQVVNEQPVPLQKEDYAEYLKKLDGPLSSSSRRGGPSNNGGVPAAAPPLHHSSAATNGSAATTALAGNANGKGAVLIPHREI